MSARTPILVVLSLVAAATLVHYARAAARAQQRCEAATAALTKLHVDACELVRLRGEIAGVDRRPLDQTGLVGDINRALVQAGVAVSALTSLAPDAEIASAGGANGGPMRVGRQGARLTLEQVSLPQLGQFLNAWRKDQPRWTVSSIQVQPVPEITVRKTQGNAPTGDGRVQQPLRIYLVLESICLIPSRESDQP